MKTPGLPRVLGVAALALAALGASVARADSPLSPELSGEIDRTAREVIASTGVPGASIAVVRDGRIAYVQAYGEGRLAPRTAARPDMRYSIGSISKQFTAAALLLLVEDRKLSLDDPVSRFVPTITRAEEITVRQLLSHTSGIQDYWPQDYVPPFMRNPIDAHGILARWARRPLDFEPGTQYQYSNTGYVLAGLIVEKAAGTRLVDLLRRRVFGPLGMESVIDIDQARLSEADAIGYMRYALGPLREAPKEGKGWLFAAGELAMTARDLAKWNVAVIERRILSPASWTEMETEVRLKNGLGTRYGLGIGVVSRDGHRELTHGGEVSGFTATNMVLPDDRSAVTVLTNQDSARASEAIAGRIAPLLFRSYGSAAAAQKRSRAILEGLQAGRLDRTPLTENANAYFSDQAVRDFAASLGPLGKVQEFRPTAQRDRGGMTFRSYDAKFATKTVEILERDMPDGTIEQYQVSLKE